MPCLAWGSLGDCGSAAAISGSISGTAADGTWCSSPDGSELPKSATRLGRPPESCSLAVEGPAGCMGSEMSRPGSMGPLWFRQYALE